MVMMVNPTMKPNPKRRDVKKDRGSFLNVAQFLGGVASGGYFMIYSVVPKRLGSS